MDEYFEDHPPRTLKEAQAAIRERTGIERSITQIWVFLQRRGLKRLKTGSVAENGDPEEQKQFLQDTIHPHWEEAEQGRRVLYFMDASHLLYRAVLGYIWTWWRRYVPSPSGRQKLNVLGALDPLSMRLEFVTNTTTIRWPTAVELLRRLRARHPDNKPLTVFLDRVSYQDCAAVKEEAQRLNIDLEFFPVGSPNLNLIERLWKWLRSNQLATKTFDTFHAFCEAIKRSLKDVFSREKKTLSTRFAPRFEIIDEVFVLAA